MPERGRRPHRRLSHLPRHSTAAGGPSRGGQSRARGPEELQPVPEELQPGRRNFSPSANFSPFFGWANPTQVQRPARTGPARIDRPGPARPGRAHVEVRHSAVLCPRLPGPMPGRTARPGRRPGPAAAVAAGRSRADGKAAKLTWRCNEVYNNKSIQYNNNTTTIHYKNYDEIICAYIIRPRSRGRPRGGGGKGAIGYDPYI